MTSAHRDDPINVSSCVVSGVRSRRDLGVGCDSSSGERTGDTTSIGAGRLLLSSWSDDGRETLVGDGGNGGSVEYKSEDAGRDLTAISDEEHEGGREKETIMSAICFSSEGVRFGRPRRVVFSPSISRRALCKASFSCFSSLSSSSASARILLSVDTILFASSNKA